MHIMPVSFFDAEPIELVDLRDLLGLEAHILRALAREKDDPEAVPHDADLSSEDCAN